MYDPLEKYEKYGHLKRELLGASAHLAVTGCMESQKVQLVSKLSSGRSWILYIAPDETAAQGVCEDFKNLGINACQYPARDLLFYNSDIQGRYLDNRRTEALRMLIEERKGLLVACADALMEYVPARQTIEKKRFRVFEGMVTDSVQLGRIFASLGYEREPMAETYGQYAIRGGIIDIYPMASDNPYRIELFGDEVDTIRTFDAVSQRSLERAESFDIYPASHGGSASEEVSLADYFDQSSLFVMDNPIRIQARLEAIESEVTESFEYRTKKGIATEGGDAAAAPRIFSASEAISRAASGRVLFIAGFDERLSEFGVTESIHFETESVGRYRGSFDRLVTDLKAYQKKGFRVTLLTPSITRTSRLSGELRSEGLRAYCPDEGSEGELRAGDIEVICGSLRQGYIYSDLKYALITEEEIFGKRSSAGRRKKRDGEGLSSLGQLVPGDYVVHEDHGIGIYRGVEHIVRNDIGRDYIRIEYADKGSLYLPATKLELLQKYTGGEGHAPKLSRLNGTEWKRTRQKVLSSVRDITADLMKLYAGRLNARGYSFSPDTVWQKEFEELFPYEETADQMSAIAAVKADMESSRVMDRLICGDVGYGKTEIALRACFKAVQDGKQAVVLVPTTVLAQQHYNTFTERLSRYPVNVAVMSRFRSQEENRKTAAALKSGGIDIVIGTHRLLSKDVGFKDLGLLVIDEEQRFGVAGKEKIKQLKTNVDVITLSATPIPRTLHMSLTGIRDLSLLDEPPFDRVPIQTYVLEYNDEYVREAVQRELLRKGQVFYVYNRVRDIADKCRRLRQMLPDARIEYAHGQMPESALEDIMFEFAGGNIDVLVSTTIVESGLDIPNANTLIVDGAEQLGLSQLYQLRGRVGRSSRTAYSFFMYRKDRILGEEAEKRLKAIREFTGFGSGVRIAMRDLEIRGAGNVLGAEQHGQMAAVGYELYCKLLGSEVRKARGIEEEKPEFETSVDIELEAYIPADYIADEGQKLGIYKQISEIRNRGDYDDITDELVDRFGDMPAEVKALLDIALLRVMAHDAYVTELEIRGNSMRLAMYPQADIDVDCIPELIKAWQGKLRFVTGTRPGFVYREPGTALMRPGDMMKKAAEIIAGIKSGSAL